MKEILVKARELIAEPKNWTKGSYARNSEGYPVSCNSEDAFCFCSLGAIQRAAADRSLLETEEARQALRRAIMIETRGVGRFIDSWNDAPMCRHADVLAAFDRAIDELSV